MRVGLDARPLNEESSGIGTYVENLIRELLALDPALELRLVTRQAGLAARFDSRRCSEVIFDAAPLSFRTMYGLALRLAGEPLDLFHATFNIMPSGLRVPVVVTLHDIMQIQNPANIERRVWAQLTAQLFWRLRKHHAIRQADRLLTPSRATRDAVLERYEEVAFARFAVTPLGVDPYFLEPPDPDDGPRVAQLLGTDAPYILTVGNGSPHKNHRRALEAFLAAFDRDSPLRLVLVRRFLRGDTALQALLARPECQGRVVVLGHVERPVLRALYRQARVFFFPSWVEGFGLPILESMACSTPVVTADRSALAEVSGQAAVTVNPFDVQAMAQALQNLAANETLREQLVRVGLERARLFTWRKTAEATLAAYRGVVSC